MQRTALKTNQCFFLLLLICSVVSSAFIDAAEQRPNLLFVSVDDLSCDSVGAFGCILPGTTPAIDAFAASSLRFQHAHVQVGNCMPSRNVMFSGLYPHTNKVEGFYQVRDPGYPVLCELMQQAGYFTAIRGKVSHSTPYSPFAWDAVLDDGEQKYAPKDVSSYYLSTSAGIAASRDAQKPFCLLINISDPHKPFWGEGAESDRPSRVFSAAEVPVPGFLPDTPEIRDELALYYSTVRRADDCFAGVMRALDESGQSDNTVVIFLSDHGMPLPFAKTQLYHHSTHTPWLVRWPGVTTAGAVDTQHMISSIDLLPTLLDIVAAEHPAGLQGQSFLPLLRGQTQPGRELVYKEYNQNSGGACHPIRSVQSKQYLYLWNPWSDGTRVFRSATQATVTYRQMQRLARTNSAVAERLKLLDQRLPEEFYDVSNDPDALHNLIDSPRHQQLIQEFRDQLQQWMQDTQDEALQAWQRRDDPQFVSDWVDAQQQESDERRQRPARNAVGRRQQPEPPEQELIALTLPKSAAVGQTLTVQIPHQLPQALGTQQLHVTLKDGQSRRIARKVVAIVGAGTATVEFTVPDDLQTQNVFIAAFVGPEFAANLQHINQSLPVSGR